MATRVVSVRAHLLLLAVLLGLTVLTWRVAYWNLGPWNTPVALLIAAVKATLVVLFFMHAWYSSRLTKLVIVAGLFWLTILESLTMADYLTRGL